MEMLWKSNYELGVKIVDEQHKELFERVDIFILTLRSSEPWEDRVIGYEH